MKKSRRYPSKERYDRKYEQRHKKIAIRLHKENDRDLIAAIEELVSASELSQQELIKSILRRGVMESCQDAA